MPVGKIRSGTFMGYPLDPEDRPKYCGTPERTSGGIAHLQRNMVYHVVYYIDWAYAAYMYRQDIHKYTVYSVNERLSDT